MVIVNGALGDHGTAILTARNDLALETADRTATARRWMDWSTTMLAAAPGDPLPARSRRAAARNGAERDSRISVGFRHPHLDEAALPLREEVQGACEILGLDPLYLANEGKLVARGRRGRLPIVC